MLNNRFSYFKRISGAKKVTVLIVSLIALLIPSGCEVIPEEPAELSPPTQSTPKVEYVTVPVKKGTINDELKNISGKFVCLSTTDVMYTESGLKLKEIKVKAGDTVNAGDVIVVADSTDLEDTIKQKELSLKKQQLEYEQKKAKGANIYELEMLQLDIDAANEELQRLYASLSQTTLTAPVSGQVSYVADLKEGDPIEAKKVLVKIADVSQLYFECTSTDQNIIGKLALGMSATVYYNNKNYEAEIVSTPRDNKTTGDDKVRLRVKNFTEGAKAIGKAGSFNVLLQKKENVLITKKSYLNYKDGNYYANVLENGVKTQKQVQIGIQESSATGNVEIISGLKEGDQVIVNK